jgi:hypothetical protein
MKQREIEVIWRAELLDYALLHRGYLLADGSAAVPIEQTDATPAHEEFHKSITEKSASQLKSYWSKMIFSGKGTALKEVASNAELLKLLAGNPAMIGYVDKTAADKTVKVVFAP